MYGATLPAITRNSSSFNGSCLKATHACRGGRFPPVAASDPNKIRSSPILRICAAASLASSGEILRSIRVVTSKNSRAVPGAFAATATGFSFRASHREVLAGPSLKCLLKARRTSSSSRPAQSSPLKPAPTAEPRALSCNESAANLCPPLA